MDSCESVGLEEDGFIVPLFLYLLFLLLIGPVTVLFCSTYHVDQPFMAANQSHDITHTGRVHCDAVAFVLEWIQNNIAQVYPFLGFGCVVVDVVKVTIRIDTISSDEELVYCKVAVGDAERV